MIANSLAELKAIPNVQLKKLSLAIIDLDLPGTDKFEALKYLMKSAITDSLPIFVLTEAADLNLKIRALELGVDDYLAKTIHPLELRARLHMRLRKSKLSLTAIEKGNLVIENQSFRAFHKLNGEMIDLRLTTKEFKLLSFFLRAENQVLTRSEILQGVWGEDLHILNRTVDSHVYGLRKKIGPLSSYIEAVPQVGYRFCLESVNSVDSTESTNAIDPKI